MEGHPRICSILLPYTKRKMTDPRLISRQGILPAGASAALHLTYNASQLAPGNYLQSITVNSNDPRNMTSRLQVIISGAQQQALLFQEFQSSRLCPSKRLLSAQISRRPQSSQSYEHKTSLVANEPGQDQSRAEVALILFAVYHTSFQLS